MDWKRVEQNWDAMVPAIVARWPQADADEVAAIDGNRDALNIYLGQVSGLTPREANEAIDEWLAGPFPSDAVMDPHNDNSQILHSANNIPAGEDPSDDDAAFGDDDIAQSPVGRD